MKSKLKLMPFSIEFLRLAHICKQLNIGCYSYYGNKKKGVNSDEGNNIYVSAAKFKRLRKEN